MTLKHAGYIDLPEHQRPGGFDHAAVHDGNGQLYVAHTCNDALDVIDCATDRYLHSIPNLTEVAGALADEKRNLIFTSNRGENTVGIFAPDDEAGAAKVRVGVKPNGLAFDSQRGLLLAANVGDPAMPGSFTVSLVDVTTHTLIADVPVPGRTRWTIFDAVTNAFYVNIADPAQIVTVDPQHPTQVARIIAVPVAGPHGLDLDTQQQRLFCACDAKQLITLDITSGAVQSTSELSGKPDVIFFNAAHQYLYVAIGDPGVIDVLDTVSMQRIQVLATEKGAHTIGFDAGRNKVYAFLPETHRAAVYVD